MEADAWMTALFPPDGSTGLDPWGGNDPLWGDFWGAPGFNVSPTPAVVTPAITSGGLPSWVIPAGLAAVALILVGR